jgi:hypothetical protein
VEEVTKLVRGEELEPFESTKPPAAEALEAEQRKVREEKRRPAKETSISPSPLKTPGQA